MRRPILVTGSHRFGSTWVGRTIALSPDVGYIHEPFNIRHRPGVCRARFDKWFTYVCADNGAAYETPLRECLNFRYHLLAELRSTRCLKDIARLARDYSHFVTCATCLARPLMKDPIAFFSAEWLADTFNMDVVVLLRHPAAFVGSLKKARWIHPFEHFLQQPRLMQDYLCEFADRIHEFARTEKPIVDQGILLWNIIHSVIHKLKRRRPSWTFIRHEDLSMDPLVKFAGIYQKLQLRFSPAVETKICKMTNLGDNHGRHREGKITRDSAANVWNWQSRLSDGEIARAREGTAEIAQEFYADSDWGMSRAAA